jgi:hypothetical protein
MYGLWTRTGVVNMVRGLAFSCARNTAGADITRNVIKKISWIYDDLHFILEQLHPEN